MDNNDTLDNLDKKNKNSENVNGNDLIRKEGAIDLVEIKKTIYKLQFELEKLLAEERHLSDRFHESIPVKVSDHALIQFCDRIKPKGMLSSLRDSVSFDPVRIFMLECVARSKTPWKTNEKDNENQYFYKYNVEGKDVEFLVKNNNIITVWENHDGYD